jgi:hypothetical protein
MRDVAPTILGLLGQPPGEHMTGHCITDRGAVPGGVEIHHDRAARPAARPVAAPGHAASSSPAGPEQRLVEDRLRDLGYLE